MIYIANGFPRSGKDTFCQYCIDAMDGAGVIFSTVDFIKEFAIQCGWDGDKTPAARKGISEIKAIMTEWLDAPFNITAKNIEIEEASWRIEGLDPAKCAVFIMCREASEIEKFVKRLGAKTILIRRKEVEGPQSNASDLNVTEWNCYDYIIENTTLENLKMAARFFISREGLYSKGEN